jgi:hypothetical protein
VLARVAAGLKEEKERGEARAGIAGLAELPALGERPAWVEQLVGENAALREEVHRQREEIRALRDEIAVLKKQKPKPSIGPSRLSERKKRRRRRKGKRAQAPEREPDRTVRVEAKDVPEGSRFKGYADYFVQELVIKTETIRYRLERWLTPEGKLVVGELPVEGSVGHFGPTLRSFVLYQYYHAQVTEPLLLEELREWGVRISSGQLHRLITEGKERFHEEKDEILRVGLRVSQHIQVDDTGARHQGRNGYCTHIGNEWFAWFETTESKSRINFLELLRAGYTDYVVSGEALEYMVAQKLPKAAMAKLAGATDQVFVDAMQWQAALEGFGITEDRHRRIATEGALLGSVLAHGVNPELAVVSDDAGQFNVLCHALCWIHAERVLAKLVGFNDAQRRALGQVRTAIWGLYRDLKAYQVAPRPEARRVAEDRFDAICATKTCFVSLNLALQRMGRNKRELLLVLERPELPLHNNLSEGDIREYVKRRKISGGTRSEEGRRSRDTFASLKKTCRKLGVSFWNFVNDRLRAEQHIAPLAALIEARAQSA